MKNYLLVLLTLLGMWNSGSAQSYLITYYADAGNPGGLNTESYSASTGWTEVSGGGQAVNEWTAPINIPFAFDFYGSPVSSIKVSHNMVATFETSTTLIPGDNSSLPTASLPDKSIAVFWDAFTTSPPISTADDIDYKEFGTAPNRQFWIRWYGYELNGNSNVYVALVLEETTNRIYVVDLYSSAGGISATVGVQLNATTGIDAGSNIALSANGTATPDNDYYEFQYLAAGSCFPPTNFSVADYTATSATLSWKKAISGSTFDVEYGPSGFSPGTGTMLSGITDTFRVISGLNPYTAYDFYVAEDCPSGSVSPVVGPVSLLTAVTDGWRETFSNATFAPTGWAEAQGDLSANTTFSGSTAGWIRDEFSNTGSNFGANELISGSTNDEWLITPSMYLPAGHNIRLEFDLSLVLSSTNIPGTLAADDSIMVVISTDNGQSWQRANSLLVLDQNSVFAANDGAQYVFPLSAYSGLVKIGFYAESTVTNASNDLFIDNVKLISSPACAQPDFFRTTAITANTIDLSWNANGGNNFVISWGPPGFSQATNTATVSGTSYTISGLNSYTAYDVYIYNACANGNSDTAYIYSAITAIQPAWLEDFSGSTFAPFGWTERQGRATNNTVFTSFSTAGWLSDDFANGSGASLSARESVSSTSDDEWLLTPLIDLGSGIAYQLEFDAALTSSNGTAAGALGPDDTLRVIISTDAGNTWSKANSLINFWSGSEPTATGTHYLVDLSAYTGLVQIAFYTQSTVTNATNDFFIDNVQIRQIPSCPAPFSLLATGDGDSATISWSVLSASAPYTLSYGTAGFTPGSGTQISGILDTFITVNGLLDNTKYQFYVKADCNGIASTYGGPVNYLTPCAVFTAPFTENFDGWTAGTGTSTLGDSISVCWTRNPNSTSAYSWRTRNGSTPTTTTGPATDYSGTGNYIFTEGSSGSTGNQALLTTPFIDISALTYPTLEFYYHMYGSNMDRLEIVVSDGTNTHTETISGAQQTAATDPWKLFSLNLSALPFSTDPIQITFNGVRGAGLNSDIAIDEVVVKEATVCGVPLNLMVQNISSSSAELLWASGTGLSNVEWGPTGFTQGSGTANYASKVSAPFTISGLSPNSSYDFYVQDTCSALSKKSAWVGPYTFTTLCANVLSGQYTIGGAAGPRNFPTLDSALKVLNDCGVSAAVTFEVAAGTYSGNFVLQSFNGSSALNKVTFRGSGSGSTLITHDGSLSNATWTIDGADHLRLVELGIATTKSTAEAVGLFLTNGATHIEIDSCSFSMNNVNSETSHIFAGSSLTSVFSTADGIHASDLSITHSMFNGGNNSIVIGGNSSDVTQTQNILIANNYFTGFDDVALSIANVNLLNILNDSINSPIGRYAIDLDDIFNFNVSGNYIRNLGSVATFSIFTANEATGPVSGRSLISNNIIHSTGNWSLFLSAVNHTDVVHNTLYSDASDALYINTSDNLQVLNNILYAPKGAALTFSGGAPSSSTNLVDYNIYYPYVTNNFSPEIPVIFDGSTPYTLEAWQSAKPSWDQNSLLGDPQFISSTNLHLAGFLADNAGTPVSSVSFDYDGQPRSTSTPDIGADEFSAVACPMPTLLGITNLSGTSADATWLGSGSNYEVQWGETGFAPGTGTTISSSNDTVTISTLSPGITYDYYVRNNCAPTPSGWAGPFTFVTSCSTPLNGVYTIDAAQASTGSNFNSVKSAAMALNECGISGAVTFNIAAGTYAGPVSLGNISGSSATHRVVFNGSSTNGVIITSNGNEIIGNQATILLDSTDYVSFRNMTIRNTATAEAWGVMLTHAANYNSFINCYFDMAVTGSSDVAGLVASNSLENDNSTGINASHLLIDSCHFYGGEKGIVVDGSSSGFSCHNLQISHNTFEFMDEHAIDINEMDTVHIMGNNITNIQDVSSSYAMEIDDVNNFIITANYIVVGDEGLSIDDGNETNTPSAYSEISNNMIIAGADHAADIIDVSYVNIYHNSLVGEPAMEIDDHDFMRIRNNIFYGRSAEAFLSADVLGNLSKVDIDYNIYHGSDPNIAPIDIDGTDYSTLALWVAADNTRNANSLQGDPGFNNVANDLHMTTLIADGTGDNTLGITVDIDGDSRPLPGSSNVDIGADEYDALSCFTPSALTASSILPTSIQLQWVSGGATSWQILYGPKGFSPPAGSWVAANTNPFTVSGLTEASCYDFYVRDSCAAGDVGPWFGPYSQCTDYSCNITTTPQVSGNDVLCEARPDTLYGSTNEDMLVWLNQKGYITTQNDSLITDTIRVDSKFYMADIGFDGPQYRHVGPLTNIATAGFGNFSNGMMFTALKTIMIDSITMKSDGARSGFIRIWEPDSIDNANIDVSKATLVQEVPYEITAAGEWQLPVGIAVTPGQYFINLSFDAGSGLLFRATSGAQFPYVLENLISIDSSVGVSNFPATRVYYFFDWVVSGLCMGPVDSVEVSFGDTAIAAFTHIVSSVNANNAAVDFDASGSSGALSYSWDFGDGQSGSGVSPQHLYTANGSYVVQLIVSADCGQDTITQTVTIQGISLEESELSRTLAVYPNPATDMLHISFEAPGQQNAEITLSDLSGRPVLRLNADGLNGQYRGSVDLSMLARGVYMLNIRTAGMESSKRVIVQ